MGSDRPLWRRLVELLAWVGLALALRLWVVEPRWIPSGSMLPTLQLQDRILVEKLRPRLGLPLAPGTVVVFRPPPALVAAGYDPAAALITGSGNNPFDQGRSGVSCCAMGYRSIPTGLPSR